MMKVLLFTGIEECKKEGFLSQSRRLPLLQVVSNSKSFSVGVQSPTEINKMERFY